MFKVKFISNYFGSSQGYLSYSIEDGWSGFGLSKVAVENISPKLLDGELHEILDVEFKSLQAAFMKEKYKTYKGFHVNKSAERKHLNIVHEAFISSMLVVIEYEEGYESYPSEDEGNPYFVSESGRVHIVGIGRSTGETPVFLSMAGPDHIGGEEFSFHGIKSINLVPD